MALVQAYLEALPGIQAEFESLLLESGSFPHMDQTRRRAILRRLENAAGHPASPTKKPTRAALKLIGIGVHISGANDR
jgi:hypothetical protein